MNNIHAEVDEILRTGNKKAIVSLFLSMQGNYIRATEAEAKLAKAQAEIERLQIRNKLLNQLIAQLVIIPAETAGLANLQDLIGEKDKLIEQMLEALEAVVRVADRATVEFDMARAAIKAAKGEV